MKKYTDKVFQSFSNFNGYTGSQPSNETEYNELVNNNSNPIFIGTAPTWSEINAKIQELKDAEQTAIDKKASGKQKLIDLGLSEDEVKAMIGI